MNIKFKIKPRIIIAKTRRLLLRDINAVGFTTSSIGTYRTGGIMSDRKMLLFNIHKVNKKSRQFKDKYGKTTRMEVIRDKHWTANIYEIKPEVFRELGMMVRQYDNYFDIGVNIE